jgi:N-methylhydantoinase B
MPTNTLDPISTEIWWNRLVSIADEAAVSLLRSSFSTIIRESNDYVTVLMNQRGETIAESTLGIPAFAPLVGRATRAILEKYPRESWREGDVVLTNDPWIATGHLPDIVVVLPIFHRDRLVGFAGSAAHAPDIGGGFRGGPAELIEEGVLIRPTRLCRQGQLNADLLELVLDNVRLRNLVLGDIEAQISANRVCCRRAAEFLDDTGEEDFERISRALHGLADGAMRKAIAGLPDGIYRSTVDLDGTGEAPTHIECAVTIDGESLRVDYAGTSHQVSHSINCTLNYTRAYTIYPLKCVLDPDTRRNEGSYRSIEVTAPPGTILNPTFPAPVMARHLTGHALSCALYRALAEILPDRIIADSGGAPALRAHFGGATRDGGKFGLLLFASAGIGASGRRDGLSTTAFPTNSGAGSVEALESASPLLFLKKEFRADSGGAGRKRGGLGQDCEVLNISGRPVQIVLLGDREAHPALGVMGGSPGAPARAMLSDGSTLPMKSRTTLRPDQSVTISFPGGGGFGEASARSTAEILDDIRQGLISREAARLDYPDQMRSLGDRA